MRRAIGPGSWPRLVWVWLMVLAMWVAQPVGATLTDPVLSVSRATRIDGVSLSVIEVEGAFPFDDLVQLPVPLQLVVFAPTDGSYLRIDVVLGGFTGTLAGLADGLDVGEATALLGAGVARPEARLVGLEPGRVVIQAPAALIPPGAQVQLFLDDAGEITLSNAILVEEQP